MTQDPKYGLPKLKKYPMPDADHVRSAIKFFNYVTPSNEQELANAILARMDEYGISPDSMNIGDENRFKKYLISKTELKHHGILGQKWGVRRYQNPDGSLTPAGQKRYDKNFDKTYNKLTKKLVQKYDTAARGNTAVNEAESKFMNSKAYKRVEELETPYHPSHRGMNKKEHQKAMEEAYKNTHREIKKLLNESLDKYGNTLMKDLKIKDDIGVKDAVKKALIDSSNFKNYITANLNWIDEDS